MTGSVTELTSGESPPRHFHHGIETGDVLQGSRVQFSGKATHRARDRHLGHHAARRAARRFHGRRLQSLKLYTAHVVDQGKPLYEWLDVSPPGR